MNTKQIRYIGSKESLIQFLLENFKKYTEELNSFVDIFSGTNIVSYHVSKIGVKNLSSYDMSSYSESLSSLVNPNITDNLIEYIKHLDTLKLSENGIFFNEFSINGNPLTISKDKFKNQQYNYRMFFSEIVGKKIDTIREKIILDFNNEIITEHEKNICMSFLLRYADSNANTTGVYGAYLKKENKKEKPFLTEDQIKSLLAIQKKEVNYHFKKLDVLNAIKDINGLVDLIYMDPPYNTRKYETNYHILEYISDIDFKIENVKYDTISGVPNIRFKNPFGSKSTTKEIFDKMILDASKKCKTLIISYNNQGIMTDSDIKNICDKYNLKLETVRKDYKKYKSHNVTVQGDVEEILWIIKNKY
jgi:adenine-specific DNA-methyltransferase